ncbi:hypothetical protein BCU68_05140 [Vibrio sp. 10N.286.49.B3]|uniref:DUF2069 domain-containing protein n=1 Tax=Vibrio sp. 10N.286.49.B3 TaxID=1880855 RepID=UPI000C851ED9|nr:DUF2069 domain-containing protein [Vibrio sp. 10N.286.49.B3]PMH41067.1 hypothetical protein BCU68_05140 [Vibrio sp. 10N.286.49.B3]
MLKQKSDYHAMAAGTKRWRIFALSSHLCLLVWVILWQSMLSPHPHLDQWIVTIAWSIPLLLPLPGIVQGKPYTHAWGNFVLMLYFLHALTIIYINGGERLIAAIELLLTSGAFIGNILFARLRGKELGLHLKRLSEVEKHEKAQFSPPQS